MNWLDQWREEVRSRPGAEERIAKRTEELRLMVALVKLREDAGLSQRELAKRMGVSQPRIAAIENAKNVTVQVLDQYVASMGGQLQIRAHVHGGQERIVFASPTKSS